MYTILECSNAPPYVVRLVSQRMRMCVCAPHNELDTHMSYG